MDANDLTPRAPAPIGPRPTRRYSIADRVPTLSDDALVAIVEDWAWHYPAEVDAARKTIALRNAAARSRAAHALQLALTAADV